MRLTTTHYFDFGPEAHLVGDDLVRPDAWDALRTKSSGPFALPAERTEWERLAGSNEDLAERAGQLARLLPEGELTLASYGAGTAQIELLLHGLRPEIALRLTDYAPAAAARLESLFTEAEVVTHDLEREPPLAADWHLFHRIDTELPDRAWRGIFQRWADERIVVVATDVAPSVDLLKGMVNRLRPSRRVGARAGWARNRAAFESLWRASHDARPVRLHDLEAWVLTPRTRNGR